MLRKIKFNFTNIVLITGFLFIFWINFFPGFPSADDHGYEMSVLSEAILPDETQDLDDTTRLTYGEFRNMEQQQRNLQSQLDAMNRGINGDDRTILYMSFQKYSECYDCLTATDFRSRKSTDRYYLVLPGYELKDNNSHFFMRKGSYYIKYGVWDKIYTLKNGEKERSGHYENKSIPFRFSRNPQTPVGRQKGSVLIPISVKTYNTLSQPVMILNTVLTLALLYVCIALPAKVLIRISRGQIFTGKNVRQLYLAAWCWLLPPLIGMLIQHILKWSFHHYVTSDVQITTWENLKNNQMPLIAGLIILAVAKSFKKGLSLQDEQDLTI